MFYLKTATSALTAALLVTGIGLAVAQTDDQQQPADPMTAATAAPTSEQTPADPNALPPVDSTAQTQQQQQTPPVTDPARTTPPVDAAAPLPSTMPAQPASDNAYPTPANTSSPSGASPSYEPAPRADRN